MKNLYIVGAGGFGREVYAWLLDLPGCDVEWSIQGFLDDNLSALDGFNYERGVVARISDFQPNRDDLFVCAIGARAHKRRICEELKERGASFFTVVHPTVIVGPNVTLGEGVVLCPRVSVTCDVEIGEMAMLNLHCTVGHDVRIGAWSTVSAQCDLTGFVQIGEGAFLGSGVRVIPGKRVGDDAVVGAGSVVIRNVRDGQKVFGNPAREFA
jgi:sugar O-acyltransferase (sialic acid O-acetyltransferase NeuD family)